MKENPIRDKSFQFALRIINLYRYLINEKKEFVIAKQLLRCGTAIGALIEEAIEGESKPDFIHKLSIANKEAKETHYWLRLLRESDYIEEKHFISIEKDCIEILKLLTSIINSTKRNHNLKK